MVLLEGVYRRRARRRLEKRNPGSELIRLASSQLKQLKIQRAASNDDVPCGGIGLYLRFFLGGRLLGDRASRRKRRPASHRRRFL